ncbi:apolipoprotein N-acyltransferase [Moraxella caviae]|nr:apolipoprotein N-acyltransferase [Moraxella caviae]OOR87400.1 apolipoprotein N-acyltransferase [Moraxella caviae]
MPTTHRSQSVQFRLPTIIALLLALLAGAVFSYALAPHYIWGLAIVSPMVLYALLLGDVSTKRAFWTGQFYGFGLWAVGAFWLYTSIHEYGAIAPWLAVLMIGAMAFVMGLFHGVMAWLFVRFLGRQPLAFAGLWVLQEWLKTWLLTGFPWLFVGYAFTEQAWINELAPIFGVFGISFVVVLFAASIVELVRRHVGFMAISVILLAIAAVLSAAGVSWVKPTGEKLSVSLVQGNIPQDIKWLTEYRERTLAIYDQLSRGEWGQDLVVWPEAAIPLFQDEAQEYIARQERRATKADSAWISGILYRESDKFYNSVMLRGADKGLYHKQNLVPFGEYVPMAGLFDILPNLAGMQNVASTSKGNPNQAPFTIKGKKLGAAICYEVAYPETTRQNAKDSNFLLTVSNDAWFGTSAGPWQHLQMVQMRSLETGRPFVRATNTGVTAFINEKGRIMGTAPQFERVVLRGKVETFTGTTPFVRFGSYPILAISLVLVLLSLVAHRQSKRTSRTQTYYTGEGVRD